MYRVFLTFLKSKYLITIQNWIEQIENHTRANTDKLSEFQLHVQFLDIIKEKKIKIR